MGVIKKEISKAVTATRSQESLYSSDFSDPGTPPEHRQEEAATVPDPIRRNPELLRERLQTCHRKRIGVRRARRLENTRFLETLVEDTDQEVNGPTLQDLCISQPSPLTRLFQSYECMRIWQYFISRSEEEQHEYLKEISKMQKKKTEMRRGTGFTRTGTECPGKKQDPALQGGHGTVRTSLKPEERFLRLERGMRRVLRSGSLDLDLLEELEKEVVEVFQEDSDTVYVFPDLSNYERLLVHGCCAYLNLISRSWNVGPQRRLKVYNKNSTFDVPSVLLHQYLECLHSEKLKRLGL